MKKKKLLGEIILYEITGAKIMSDKRAKPLPSRVNVELFLDEQNKKR